MPELVDIGNDSLAVRRSGNGPTALLIHGTAPATWGELPVRLASTHAVVDYDRRGFSASPGPPPRALTGHADDAAGLLERLDAGPAVIVGWSVGGVIALELALRRPELVAGLVLLEPPFRAKRHPRAPMVWAIGGATMLARVGRADAGAQRFLRWALGRRGGGDDLARVDAEDLRRSSATIVAELAAGTGEHLDRDALAVLELPTTVIAGSESDPAFAAAARRVSELIPGSRLVTATGSGHMVQLDAPEFVAGEVRQLAAMTAA